MSDTRPREVVVPEVGPVTLTALMDGAGAFTYAPPVVGRVAQLRDEAVQAAADAEAAATTAATNVETQLSGYVTDAEAAAVRAEAGAAVVGNAQTVLDARDTAVDAADRAEIAAAAVAFTEDPPGSGLYTFPTTAGA